nr:hypothetical protein [Tanacetum cinerariifolium]
MDHGFPFEKGCKNYHGFVMEGEIENPKAQLLLREAEAAEAIHVRAQASDFEAVEKSIRDETDALKERNAILEKEQNALDVKAPAAGDGRKKVRVELLLQVESHLNKVNIQLDKLIIKTFIRSSWNFSS